MGRYTSLDSSQPFDRHLSYGQYPELSQGAPGAWLPSAGGQRQVFLATFLSALAAAAAKSRQSCPTLCDPIDGSPPGSPVPGILQARTWSGLPLPSPVHESEVAQSFPTLATPWTAAHQAPPSPGFSRQECWSGVPLPSPSEFP